MDQDYGCKWLAFIIMEWHSIISPIHLLNAQPKAKIWRKRSEGLKLTQKGKKTGNNGRQVKLFVAIAYMERGS